MIDPAVFICKPLDFQGICKVYPPTISDVVTNENFGAYQKMFTITQQDLIDEQTKHGGVGKPLTPLEFLLSCSYNNGEFREMALKGFEFFIREPVTFLYENKTIIIGDLKEPTEVMDTFYARALREDNYTDFQNTIRTSLDMKIPPPLEEPDPDEDPRITRIKQRARERDAIKARQQNKGGFRLSTCLAAICCMGIGITPLNVGELSYASIGTIMNMMQEKEKYDIDIRSLLAGADSKKVKPKYWIRDSD